MLAGAMLACFAGRIGQPSQRGEVHQYKAADQAYEAVLSRLGQLVQEQEPRRAADMMALRML
jgi:hypothetical protein